MTYNEKKATELRELCIARKLPSSGSKQALISRLIKSEQNEPPIIKREENEMQVDVSIPILQRQQQQQQQKQQLLLQRLQQQQQQQQPQASTSQVSESGPPHNIKCEYEPTFNELQAMVPEELPTPELILPQQPMEHQQEISPNVDMSSECSESINPVGHQQQLDHLPSSPSSPSTATSPIVTHIDVPSSSSSSINGSLEQNRNNQTQPFDSSSQSPSPSSSCTYQKDEPQNEIDRDLLARLISERKYGTHSLHGLSRGIMMNQGRANGTPYDYDLLLEMVQGSLIYNDGEIPYWLKGSYDSTFGTTYFGESECVLNPAMPVEDLFLNDQRRLFF